MYAKDRDKTNEIQRFQALLRRILQSHYKRESIESDFKRKKSEVKGEQQVDYPLSFLDANHHLILHNVRLEDENGYFQIDTLILTEKYILILEVKNWYGTIFFGENGQVTRVGDEQKEEGFSNPISQVKVQRHRLRRWLRSNGYPDIPLKFFVVISHSSTIIKSTSTKKLIPNKVIHSNELFFKVQALSSEFTTTKIRMERLIKLSKLLAESHVPPKLNILSKYNLTKEDLIKGVICPKCGSFPMTRVKRKWFCRNCKYTSVTAHFPALNDYKLLIGDRIKNREAREFLQIDSPYVVKRILMGASIKAIGSKANRVYKLKTTNWI